MFLVNIIYIIYLLNLYALNLEQPFSKKHTDIRTKVILKNGSYELKERI